MSLQMFASFILSILIINQMGKYLECVCKPLSIANLIKLIDLENIMLERLE